MKLFGLYNEDEDENDDEYDSGLTSMAALSRVAGFPV
jgi:hypothetical protein